MNRLLRYLLGYRAYTMAVTYMDPEAEVGERLTVSFSDFEEKGRADKAIERILKHAPRLGQEFGDGRYVLVIHIQPTREMAKFRNAVQTLQRMREMVSEESEKN